MFPKLSTSTQDTSIADLMVSMDNNPEFTTIFYSFLCEEFSKSKNSKTLEN